MDDCNGNVIVNKASLQDSNSHKSDPSLPDVQTSEHEFAFGWGKFRPKSLQFLSSPFWFIVVFCVYALLQGIATWGLPSLILPSIERRFGFSTKELGVIAGSNDAAALILVVFISYYGDYGNKIKWIAGGALITGIGIIVFALPHFMIGRYHPGNKHSDSLCNHGNGTQCVEINSGGDWYYLTVFILGMLIIGAGTAPYFSLFSAYLDENVEPKSFPLYLGTFSIIQFIAPGIGFVIGGKFLSIYVDINQPNGFNLTPKDPRWIGAWWLGFLTFGILIVLFSFIMLGFPSAMPGAKEKRLKHIREGNIKPSNGVQPSLKKLPFELKELLKNWTFLFNTLALTCFLFYFGAAAVFYSKLLRVKFGLDAVKAGYFYAIINISGAVVGNIVGSIIVRIFSLKTACKNAAAACTIVSLLTIGGPLIFLIPSCINTNLAGVAVDYDSFYMNSTATGLLKAQCNVNCGCSLTSFSPVCGSDNVTYFDACHAGCNTYFDDKSFANCSCIPNGLAKPGYCDRQCKNLVIFTLIAIMLGIIRIATSVPTKIVMLRCVPDNKRAFASGVWYVTFKTFGLLPSPVVFGHIVDKSCRLWQNICGRRGRCFDYDITSLSQNIAYYGLALTVLTTLCFFLSWYFCKSCAEGVCIENQGIDQPEETRF